MCNVVPSNHSIENLFEEVARMKFQIARLVKDRMESRTCFKMTRENTLHITFPVTFFVTTDGCEQWAFSQSPKNQYRKKKNIYVMSGLTN